MAETGTAASSSSSSESFLKVGSKSQLQISQSSLFGLDSYNRHQIGKHTAKDDLWIILNQRVYDITGLLAKHPGGADIILEQLKLDQDLTPIFYKMMHSVDALSRLKGHCVGTVDKAIIGWGDLFSVKISMLDEQHKQLIRIMNDIYCTGDVNHLNKFIIAWKIHCQTEQYFMKTHTFSADMKTVHINEHHRIIKNLETFYDSLLQKYKDKIHIETGKRDDEKSECEKNTENTEIEIEPFECQELIDFCVRDMGATFKTHAFQYDSLYIDKIGNEDDCDAIHTEKVEYGLIKPIFPN